MAEEKVKMYADLYAKAYTQLKEDLLDKGADYEAIQFGAGAVLHEVAKDLRTEMIDEMKTKRMDQYRRDKMDAYQNRGVAGNGNGVEAALATNRQRNALHKFGVDYLPGDITKHEASDMLAQLTSTLDQNGDVSAIVEQFNEKYKAQRE